MTNYFPMEITFFRKTSASLTQQYNTLCLAIFGKINRSGTIAISKNGHLFISFFRKAGTGYSDYSSSIYLKRPYIWPPLRKLFNFNFYLVIVGLMMLFIDYEWSVLPDCNSSFRLLEIFNK